LWFVHLPGELVKENQVSLMSLHFRKSNFNHMWQKLHSHADTRTTVCSFVSFTHYLIYLRRRSAKKICLWRCLLHHSFPSHSW
jgi:hypothetical protein